MRKIQDAVVVITGASSGIGRAAAHVFAKSGATLALAARREQPLNEAAEEARNLGARAVAVPTDVTDAEAVEALARMAVENFGRIDVWVNNAAVTLFAPFEEAPMEAYRRVIETNLFGYIHGARAALRYFREQGSGVLVNNASMVARAGQPYTSAYVLTKFAIRGLGECLRQELLNAPDIHVCTVLPASIDTPLFQHAANYTGRAIRAMPPVYSAAAVARAIARLAERPRREVFVGNAGRMTAIQKMMAPGLTERMLASMVDRNHFQDRPAPPSAGNLFEPMDGRHAVSGGWRPASAGRPWAPMLATGIAIAAIPIGMAAARRLART
jgi:NAD(P)-dependent dehydrogenase (short-subunit alcohol dehydrogenase family)